MRRKITGILIATGIMIFGAMPVFAGEKLHAFVGDGTEYTVQDAEMACAEAIAEDFVDKNFVCNKCERLFTEEELADMPNYLKLCEIAAAEVEAEYQRRINQQEEIIDPDPATSTPEEQQGETGQGGTSSETPTETPAETPTETPGTADTRARDGLYQLTVAEGETEIESLVIHFPADEDGKICNPVITLTTPSGETVIIDDRTSVPGIDITWESEFCQIDFCTPEAGKWIVESQDPVTMNVQPYIGERRAFKPLEETTSAPTAAPEVTEKKEKKSMLPLVIFGIIMAGLIGMLVVMMKMTKKNTEKEKKKTGVKTAKKQDSDEDEILKEIQSQLQKRKELQKAQTESEEKHEPAVSNDEEFNYTRYDDGKADDDAEEFDRFGTDIFN